MKMKKVLLGTYAAGAVLLAGQLAFASGNMTTGPCSDNDNSTDIGSSKNIEVVNKAIVNDNFCFDVQNGENEIAKNTVVGDVSTGNIDGRIDVSRELNNGMISVISDDDNGCNGGSCVIGLGDLADMSNNITGPDSTNINHININHDNRLKVKNIAKYDSNYNFDLNTGRNNVGRNTKVGDVSTGDVNIAINESITANRNGGNISIPSMHPVMVSSMTNDTTGPGSTNENSVNINSENTVDVKNISRINNDVNANINTGENTINKNTVVGNVSTGSVSFTVNVSSSAN